MPRFQSSEQQPAKQNPSPRRLTAAVVATTLCALLASSALHAADADAIVAVTDENSETGACTITVEPAENAKCESGGQDICVEPNTKLEFTSQPSGREFVIVPDPWRNPLFVSGFGSGKCKARSKNGRLKCKVDNPSPSNPADVGYKFWVFADGCVQPLDPRIFVR